MKVKRKQKKRENHRRKKILLQIFLVIAKFQRNRLNFKSNPLGGEGVGTSKYQCKLTRTMSGPTHSRSKFFNSWSSPSVHQISLKTKVSNFHYFQFVVSLLQIVCMHVFLRQELASISSRMLVYFVVYFLRQELASISPCMLVYFVVYFLRQELASTSSRMLVYFVVYFLRQELVSISSCMLVYFVVYFLRQELASISSCVLVYFVVYFPSCTFAYTNLCLMQIISQYANSSI